MKTKENRHMPKLHIKKGDMVMVMSGEDKGKKARVQEVLTAKRKAFVEGVNMISRHMKPQTSKTNVQGGIVKKEAAVPISRLQVIDPKNGNPIRVARKTVDGKSVRFSTGRKASGEIIK